MGSRLGVYDLERELGRGGMGAVYVGKHELLKRKAAVKILLPQYSKDQSIVQRFFNEARAAAEIRHPSIVEIFDFGFAADGAAYIVMELCEGEPLSHRLRRQRTLTPGSALSFTRQIANALAAAHKANIIHRDLKPDNIFLERDPEVAGGERIKLLDFGIAKLMTDLEGPSKTSTGAIIGTPHYMSPEQCRGAGGVDHRSDLYSLGCILFEMVCGRVPFVGEGAGDIIGAHLLTAPPRPTQLNPDVPDEIEALIADLLAKKPADRPQTAEQVAARVQKLQARFPPPEQPDSASSDAIEPSLAAGTEPPLGNANTAPPDLGGANTVPSSPGAETKPSLPDVGGANTVPSSPGSDRTLPSSPGTAPSSPDPLAVAATMPSSPDGDVPLAPRRRTLELPIAHVPRPRRRRIVLPIIFTVLGIAAAIVSRSVVPDEAPEFPAATEDASVTEGDLRVTFQIIPPTSATTPPMIDVTVAGAPVERGAKYKLKDAGPLRTMVPASKVTSFAAGPESVAIGFVIQTSENWLGNDSYEENESNRRFGAHAGVAKALADTTLRELLPPKSEMMIVTYADRPKILMPPSPIAKLDGTLIGTQASFKGDTGMDLVGAITLAELELRKLAHPHKVLVILSDGTDTNMETARAELTAMKRTLAADRIDAYSIVYKTYESLVDTAVTTLAPRTTTVINSVDAFRSAIASIANRLASRYYLTFPGADLAWDGRAHDIALLAGDTELQPVELFFPRWALPPTASERRLPTILLLAGLAAILVAIALFAIPKRAAT